MAVADTPWVIRNAAAGDGEFLADMLVAAVNWSAGIRRISLSVERANFARGLYRSEGYTVAVSGPQSDTMVKDLT